MNSKAVSVRAHPCGACAKPVLSCVVAWALLASFSRTCFSEQATPALTNRNERGFSYRRDIIADVPWSVNIVRIDRASTDLELHTMLAHGSRIGLNLLSEQVKALSPELGRPVAAVNGDFYRNDETPYAGDPK